MPRAVKAARAAASRLGLGVPQETAPQLPHLARRLYEPVTSDLPPATWRNASDWVDLELLRAGLPSEVQRDQAKGHRLPSRWGEDELQPEPSAQLSVLWPHSALDDHRSRAFVVPNGGQEGDQKDPSEENSTKETEKRQNKEKRQLEENQKRLESLWSMSNSHGVSWDELDVAFVAFAKEGKRRYAQWSQSQSQEDGEAEETAKKAGSNGPTAAKMKAYCEAQAVAFLKPFCPKDETGRSVDPRRLWPSHLRRLTARLYRKEKQKFLAPWAPGKLTAKLQQLVAARMIRRETRERLYGFGSKEPGSAQETE